MAERLRASQLYTGTLYSLQRVYNLLNKDNLDGVSKSDLSNYSNLATYDLPFVQFLQQNMNLIDKNSDKIISQDELNQMFQSIQQNGYTYSQLVALSTSTVSGIDSSLLSTVLANFNKIDANGDGKVSQAEINAYNLKTEITERKDEFDQFKSESFSIFYSGSESSDDSEVSI